MGRKPIVKTRSRNENKRERWIAACMDYFSEKGIRDVTMDDVAGILNISKATIYNHFKSKDEMVMTAIAIQLGELKGYEAFFSDTSLPYLERYYKAMTFYGEKMLAVSSILIRDVKEVYPELWGHVEMFRNHFNFVAIKYYQEGIDRGFIFNEIDLNVLVATDRWFLESLAETDFLEKSNLSFAEAFKNFFRIKFDGILKSKLLDINVV